MKMLQILDATHAELKDLKHDCSERSNETMCQIVARLVQQEHDAIFCGTEEEAVE